MRAGPGSTFSILADADGSKIAAMAIPVPQDEPLGLRWDRSVVAIAERSPGITLRELAHIGLARIMAPAAAASR